MATLTHRSNSVFTVSNSVLAPGASYSVTAYPVGAVVHTAASASNTIRVYKGHSFRANDKFIVGTDITTFSQVSSIDRSNASYDEFTLQGATTVTAALSAGLCNLGPDPGTGGTPDFDASPMAVYTDQAGNTAATDETVTTGSDGGYEYWHKGDGRHWELVRDADGTVTEVVQGHGAVAGRFNVADFGAKIDGSEDDTSAVQSCIEAADSGSVVFFPAGTTVITGVTLPSANVTLRGEGKTLSKLHLNSATATAIANQDTGSTLNDVTIENLSVEPFSGVTSTSNVAIDFSAVSRSTIRDCYISDMAVGVLMDNQYAGGTFYNLVSHIVCRASAGSSGFIGVRLYGTANENTLYKCQFSRLDKQIQVGESGGSNFPNSILVDHCSHESADTSAVDVNGCTGITIRNPRFENNTTALTVAGSNDVRGLRLEDPYFANNTTDITNAGAGVSIDGGRYTGGQWLEDPIGAGITANSTLNILPNSNAESWEDASTLRGWGVISGTDWNSASAGVAQESTEVDHGTYSAKVGGTTVNLRGIGVLTQHEIDPTQVYTLRLRLASDDADAGLRLAIKLLDSSSVLITTGTVVASRDQNLTYSATYEAHIQSADQTGDGAATYETYSVSLKFPATVKYIRFGLLHNGGTSGSRYVYVDRLWFGPGSASVNPEPKPLYDSGSVPYWGFLEGSSETGITAGTTQTQAGATALTAEINRVTVVGTDNDGVRLPEARAGRRCVVMNDDAAQSLRVYPDTDDYIGATQNGYVDVAANDVLYAHCPVDDYWFVSVDDMVDGT